MPETVPPVRRRTAPRSGAMVALLAGALLALTGCGGPGDAQTLQVFDAGVGVNDRDSDVYVLNALVVDNADSTGTLSVSLLDKSGDGDQLVAVEAATDAGEPIEVQQHVRPLELCDGNLEVVGPGAEVTLAGDNFAAGDVIELSFTFRDAEPVRMGVPVVSRITDVEGAINPYDSVAETPPAVPKPSDCTTATPTPTA